LIDISIKLSNITLKDPNQFLLKTSRLNTCDPVSVNFFFY